MGVAWDSVWVAFGNLGVALALEQYTKIGQAKPNQQNKICQIISTESNLPNQMYQTKLNKPCILNKIYWTKSFELIQSGKNYPRKEKWQAIFLAGYFCHAE